MLREGSGGELGNAIIKNIADTDVEQEARESENSIHIVPATGFPDYLWSSSFNIISGEMDLEPFVLDGTCEGLFNSLQIDPVLTVLPEDTDNA